MSIKKIFNKKIAKCERCAHIWIPRNDPVTCPKCRTPYWNKPKKTQLETSKNNAKNNLKNNNEKKQIINALQCAIINDFNCLFFKQKIPSSDLCKICFDADFWDDNKLKILKDAFVEDLAEDNTKTQNYEIQSNESEVSNEPMETNFDTKIVIQPKNLSQLKQLCFNCGERYMNKQGELQCNFMDFKEVPKYYYCRYCWELEELWGDRAVKPK